MDHILNYTKLFPVKSPIGRMQEDTPQFYNNAGYDFYFPEPTEEFFKALANVNKAIQMDVDVLLNDDGSVERGFAQGNFTETNEHVELYYDKDGFRLRGKMIIPTGIALIIPKGYMIWATSKSSSMGKGYSVRLGVVDCCYVDGLGFQIDTEGNDIIFQPKQKFGQIVMQQVETIERFVEMSNDVFMPAKK